MKTNLISKTETTQLLKIVSEKWKIDVPKIKNLKVYEIDDETQLDMGAVKFMCKGANLMRPGIKKFSEFSKDDIVCIVEESQNKFLAIGKSEVDSSELSSMDKGEVLKNLHYISDKAWEISKTL